MWNQNDNTNNHIHNANTHNHHNNSHMMYEGGGGNSSEDAPSYQFYSDNGNHEWDSAVVERGRERGTVQPSFDRYNLSTPDPNMTVGGGGGQDCGVDMFGNLLHHQLNDSASGRENTLSGSQGSIQFALHENFYHDPNMNTTDDYGFRSNSAASTNSLTSASRYVYERLGHDHSPSLEALTQNTSARIQSFDSGVGGGPGAHSEHRVTSSNSLHNSRHARRLYVGGMPQNQTNEEMLQLFLNDVCSKCLEEENDSSYVISVYMNHKKCFAFVELKSIELTSACLDLDGIVYCSNILKIQRANEYKPELMINVPRVPIHFNLKKAPFPNKAISSILMDKKGSHGLHDDQFDNNDYANPNSRSSSLESEKKFSGFGLMPSSFIRSCAVSDVPRGCLVLLGFPYDEGARRASQAVGSAAGPRAVRQHLYRLFGSGSGVNPEFGIDWSTAGDNMVICDVGDIPLGLLLEEALSRLGDSISDIIRRGGVPLVLGGSGDMSYANAAGLMTVAGGSIGIISINSKLSVVQQRAENKIQANSASRLLLSDTRFCPPREGLLSEPWCEGKYVQIAAQGAQCCPEEVKFVEERGGQIVWLSKDIRQVNPFAMLSSNDKDESPSQVVKYDGSPPGGDSKIYNLLPHTPVCPTCQSSDRLVHILTPILARLKGQSLKRPIFVSFNLESVHSSIMPGVSNQSYDGLSAQEATHASLLAGADENVVLFDLCGLNPDVDDVRSPVFVAQMAYSFILGFLQRTKRAGDKSLSSSPSSTKD